MKMRWRELLAAGLLPLLSGCFIFGIRVDSTGQKTSQKSDEPKRSSPSVKPCDLSDLPAVDAAERLPLAVLDFQVGQRMDGDVGRALADLCRDAIQDSGRFVLVERERIADILGERDFADAMQCDDMVCVVKYGKLLGARKMMHGRINRLGGVFVLSVGLTDVDTSTQISESASLGSLEDSTMAIPRLVCEIVRSVSVEDR
jgi:curli biogenesis system outer membrane secretion channel CsgG